MYKQVGKSKGKMGGAAANSLSQNKGKVKHGFGFVDNRPGNVAQKKLQNMASNSQRSEGETQLQAMAGNYKVGLFCTPKIIQRVRLDIEGLDTDNPDEIMSYFMTLEDEDEVEDLIIALFDAGENDLATTIEDEADRYFGESEFSAEESELSEEESKYIHLADEWESSRPFPRKRAAKRNKGQQGKSKIDPEKRMQKEIGGITGKEITREMNPIENEQESVFSDLYQGGGGRKKAFGNDPVKKNEVEIENEQRNYLRQLEVVRDKIINGSYLVRKMSEAEKTAFQKGGNKEDIFPKGIEGMKAFAIDKAYTFSDKDRDSKKDDYEYVLKINLTGQLKTFLINFLSANVSNPLGVSDKKFHFSVNPQFKFEGGGFTILIPPSGWAQFWSFVTGYSFK